LGPKNPPAAAIELIKAMPAAAEAPPSSVVGKDQNVAKAAIMPPDAAHKAIKEIVGELAYAATTKPTKPIKLAVAICQTRSPVLSE
jgi:hypothetical protein